MRQAWNILAITLYLKKLDRLAFRGLRSNQAMKVFLLLPVLGIILPLNASAQEYFHYTLGADIQPIDPALTLRSDINPRELDSMSRVLQGAPATHSEGLRGSGFGGVALGLLDIKSDSPFAQFVSSQENDLRLHFAVGQSWLLWKADSPDKIVWKFASPDKNAQHATGFAPAELRLDGIRRMKLSFKW